MGHGIRDFLKKKDTSVRFWVKDFIRDIFQVHSISHFLLSTSTKFGFQLVSKLSDPSKVGGFLFGFTKQGTPKKAHPGGGLEKNSWTIAHRTLSWQSPGTKTIHLSLCPTPKKRAPLDTTPTWVTRPTPKRQKTGPTAEGRLSELFISEPRRPNGFLTDSDGFGR